MFPELAAALTEFIRDPNRPEELYYGFCDIGGGTIDGAIFRLHRILGQRRLAILSASVVPYGVAAVARAVAVKAGRIGPSERDTTLSTQIETLLAEKEAPLDTAQELALQLVSKHGAEAKINIQKFVRRFVNEARLKRNVDGYTFADPVSGKKIELRFFLAGGGAESRWYRTTILGLDPRKDFTFYGVNKLRLVTVKRSAGFRGGEYARFVIALGLANSVPLPAWMLSI